MKAVATGNWGCGNACSGDVQLKLVIQWMAASVAGLPALIYYTAGHEKLTKVNYHHTRILHSFNIAYFHFIRCDFEFCMNLTFKYHNFVSVHSQLDTLCRLLRDRKWTVGELASITLLYAQEILDDPKNNEQQCLFESLIGI